MSKQQRLQLKAVAALASLKPGHEAVIDTKGATYTAVYKDLTYPDCISEIMASEDFDTIISVETRLHMDKLSRKVYAALKSAVDNDILQGAQLEVVNPSERGSLFLPFEEAEIGFMLTQKYTYNLSERAAAMRVTVIPMDVDYCRILTTDGFRGANGVTDIIAATAAEWQGTRSELIYGGNWSKD